MIALFIYLEPQWDTGYVHDVPISSRREESSFWRDGMSSWKLDWMRGRLCSVLNVRIVVLMNSCWRLTALEQCGEIGQVCMNQRDDRDATYLSFLISSDAQTASLDPQCVYVSSFALRDAQ